MSEKAREFWLWLYMTFNFKRVPNPIEHMRRTKTAIEVIDQAQQSVSPGMGPRPPAGSPGGPLIITIAPTLIVPDWPIWDVPDA